MQFLKELGAVRMAAIGATIVAFLLIVAIYIYKVSSSHMTYLYTDLDMADSSKIVQELDIKKIPYELVADGSAIKVPEDQVLRIRMNMASSGLPNKGNIVGYEIFNNEESLGSTTFQQNIKMVRALEGEISRTIGSFERIERARVHLVLPQKEVFSKDKQEPKASVILKMKGNKSLGKGEIGAIGHLVSSAVPGLDVKNITIVDTKGKSLMLGSQDEDSLGGYGGGSSAEDYRVAYEYRMKKVIESLLEQSLGEGKVKAQVSVEMNFDRTVINSETYDPDGSVVRSVQSVEEKERNPLGNDGGDVSVANNIP
ncbi:MAG: flagellar basal-body MS-ring/collar protein FliF, partial [Pseudomonadota bacterium]